MKIMNTMLQKQEMYKITYKEKKQHTGGPPFARPTYEVLDYVLSAQRWKNSIQDIESDPYPNIYTDHYPLKLE